MFSTSSTNSLNTQPPPNKHRHNNKNIHTHLKTKTAHKKHCVKNFLHPKPHSHNNNPLFMALQRNTALKPVIPNLSCFLKNMTIKNSKNRNTPRNLDKNIHHISKQLFRLHEYRTYSCSDTYVLIYLYYIGDILQTPVSSY